MCQERQWIGLEGSRGLSHQSLGPATVAALPGPGLPRYAATNSCAASVAMAAMAASSISSLVTATAGSGRRGQ